MNSRVSIFTVALLAFSAGVHGAAMAAANAAEQQSGLMTEEELHAAIASGYDAVRSGDLITAKRLFRKARTAPQFLDSDESIQYFVLANLSYVLLNLKEYSDAIEPTRAATEFKQANVQDWQRRLVLAHQLKDANDEALAITELATSWPKSLSLLSFDRIGYASRPKRYGGPDDKTRFPLLKALYAAQWKPENPAFTPDYQWSELAGLLLEHGNVDQAQRVYRDITTPTTLIRMTSDKRFDAITQAGSNAVDVNRAIDVELAKLRGLAEASPRTLKTTNSFAAMLLYRNQAEEALKILDAAIEKVRARPGGKDPFDDMDQINWTLNERAWALKQLGRIDEAISEETRAARKSENGGTNVSQLINLAGTYNEAQRPNDALATLEDLDLARTSAHGRMEAWGVQACAYAQQGKKTKVSETIGKMRNEGISPIQIIHAELCANNMDDAAKGMIAAFENSEVRSEMLAAVQNYLPSRGRNAYQMELETRFETLVARPDVQAALAKVGRIGTYAIRANPY